MKLYVKYMVSQTCKMVVKEELKKMGLHYILLDLGSVEIMENLTEKQHDELNTNLQRWGLELMEDKKSILVEQIKNAVLEMIHCEDDLPELKYSEYISRKLHYDYTYLSNLFTEVKGMTIRQFIINNRIEWVKELMMYDELSLTEICYKLNYSSVAYLSSQFKQVTGLTPSFYKHLNQNKRLALECI